MAIAGDAWRLRVTVDKILMYSLTANDILIVREADTDAIVNTMDDRLEAACFEGNSPVALVRFGARCPGLSACAQSHIASPGPTQAIPTSHGMVYFRSQLIGALAEVHLCF